MCSFRTCAKPYVCMIMCICYICARICARVYVPLLQKAQRVSDGQAADEHHRCIHVNYKTNETNKNNKHRNSDSTHRNSDFNVSMLCVIIIIIINRL